jgi:murein L,D-transpeptidase YcbB/YkuD
MNQRGFFARLCILSLAGLALLCAHGTAFSPDLSPQTPAGPIREQLRSRIEAARSALAMIVQGEALHDVPSLVRLYEQREFQPVWVGEHGALARLAALVTVLRNADRQGLQPAHYHLAKIETMLAELRREPALKPGIELPRSIDLELLLTDASLMYVSHVLAGRVSSETIDEAWFANRPKIDHVVLLQRVLDDDHLEEALGNFRPPHQGYAGLQQALARYRDIAARGGWSIVPEGPKLQKGDRGPRAMALRKRLQVTGELEAGAVSERDFFDAAVEQALRRFQQRHGLESDGAVGPSTLAELNVPVETRMRRLELNMERWRWLPQVLGERYILVNIPNFTLEVVEYGQPVMTMRVVVGRPTRPTPMLGGEITHLILNPHWYVPPTIAQQDKLPLIRKDPSYIARQHFKVFQTSGAGSTQIDPREIDWSKVTSRNFPYRLRQDPGSSNALGRIKFMFQNPFQVYLHDTPSRELFAKTDRAFSSGCIRLEKPLELAGYLLRGDGNWSHQRIAATIDAGKEQSVGLSARIPVYFLYWTAWADADGVVQFRRDVYDRDRVLDKILHDTFPLPKYDGQIYATVSRF